MKLSSGVVIIGFMPRPAYQKIPHLVILFALTSAPLVAPAIMPADEKKAQDPPRKDSTSEKSEGSNAEVQPKTRPAEPPAPPNPDELKVRPNADGRVRFNFVGQPWPEVLDWLAQVSNMSLDWQELPGDYLNLTTQREYSVEEARDLINRHLLARGYTLIINGELLAVANIKKLDAGLVPRVAPEELAKRQPHDFVRVSFHLDWLVAETAVEELKPLLSPNGKLTSMKSTNRVEAMDAVSNLREIHKILGQEQSTDGKDRLVREFELRHTRVAEVYPQLMKLLNVEEKSTLGFRPQSPQEMQQVMMIQQQMAQFQERMGQSSRDRSQAAPREKSDVSVVVNTRRNTLLVLAPPDKMAIVTQAVKAIDVPLDREHSLLGNIGRMQIYRLATIEPASLVKTLEDSGDLDPTTRLQADEKNRAVIAYASLADQMIIKAVIEKLDGTGRRFEVVTLRRLAADQVAGTIDFMINGPEEKTQRRSYSDYYESRSRDSRTTESKDKFRVDADVEHNRLLLWANEVELAEVRNLLSKLGEIVDRQDRNGGVRVLEIPDGEDAAEFLERIRKVWPTMAPNPLVIPEAAPAKNAVPEKAEPEKESAPAPSPPATRTSSLPKTFSETAAWHPSSELAQLTAPQRAPRKETSDAALAPPSRTDLPVAAAEPVRISVDANGRLVISSRDAAALDLLEDAVQQVAASSKKDFQVFRLKHAPAYWVRLNLLDFFKEEEKDKNSSRTRVYYYFEPPQTNESKNSMRLSKRQNLKFIADSDTNTIVVQGADASQLKTIGELIQLYDQPEPTDANSARMTEVVAIRWGKAQVIADAVKDVFRDLLSSNDKALAQSPDQKTRPSSQYTYIYSDSSDERDKRTPVSFKGKLSIGIDEISNTLIVSTEGDFLLQTVLKMIESLDEAAKPAQTVQVMKLGGGMNSTEVKKAIMGILTEQSGGEAAPSGGTSSSASQRRSRSSSSSGGSSSRSSGK